MNKSIFTGLCRHSGKAFFLFSLLLIAENSFSQAPDYFKYFDQYNVTGSFVMYNMNDSSYFEIDQARCNKRFTPASTFKIFNSLVGLETGVIADENFVLEWDSVKRNVPEWNKSQDMKTAFKNSTVWYYQELARRVGETKMKYYIKLAQYGNMDISGGIDQFWLTGNLRISQEEQIELLKKLYTDSLPFSKHSQEIVKKIMLREDTLGYKLRAKTGWGVQDSTDIGWYVGWVEKDKNVYFFATNIESKNPGNSFPAARIEITKDILRELKVLP
jgi:beta-lactamase class D